MTLLEHLKPTALSADDRAELIAFIEEGARLKSWRSALWAFHFLLHVNAAESTVFVVREAGEKVMG